MIKLFISLALENGLFSYHNYQLISKNQVARTNNDYCSGTMAVVLTIIGCIGGILCCVKKCSISSILIILLLLCMILNYWLQKDVAFIVSSFKYKPVTYYELFCCINGVECKTPHLFDVCSNTPIVVGLFIAFVISFSLYTAIGYSIFALLFQLL